MEYPACIEINPQSGAEYTVIWLHGLGADGNDFVPLIPELRLPADKAIRFVFPNAPVQPVSVNNGYVMPSWYDIYAMDLTAKIDVQGILRSADYLQTLVDAEIRSGIKPEHIVLAGFSQGGVIALVCALRCMSALGGVMALSCYLPKAVPAEGGCCRKIFQAHGRMDDVVPYTVGKEAATRLQQLGHELEWREYDMAHSLCGQEIVDIHDWILKVFL